MRYPPLYCAAGFLSAWASDTVRGEFWWGIIVLGAFISLYGWLARGEKDSGRYEIGDNCYFIGFVYTLAVIALSIGLDAEKLLSAGAAGEDSAGGLRRLLETVGIALGTSIIGMLWRFGLTHDIKIPENEFERRVEGIAKAAHKLHGAAGGLQQAVAEVGRHAANANESLRAVGGAAEAYADKMLLETEKIGEHMTEVAGKMFDDFGNRIADTLQKTQFDNVREDLQDAVEHHRAAVAATAELLKNSAEELNKAALSASDAALKINDTLDAVKTAAAERVQEIPASVNDALDNMQKELGGENWRALANAADNFSAQADKLHGGMQKIAAQQELIINAAAEDAKRAGEARAAVATLVQDLQKDAAAVAEIKQKYREQFSRAAEDALKETHLLYAKLIKGAEAALAASGDSKTIAAELQKITAHLENISQLKDSEK